LTLIPKMEYNMEMNSCDLSAESGRTFSYEEFYEIFLEVENVLLEEADKEVGGIGGKVTIAPFHPYWNFAGTGANDPVNYEKRSPFPTISIVSTSAIDNLMKKKEVEAIWGSATVTVAVGEHNEEVLEAAGTKILQNIIDKDVLND